MHRGLWTHYQRDTDEFFTKMDHGKLIWKYRLNGLSRNFVSFNCTGRSASCFDGSIDRKTWNMCWPHDIVFILYRIYFLYILLLKPSYMYKHITLNICCLQIIPFIIRNIVYDEIKTECLFYYIFVCLNTTNRFRVVRSNKLKWHTVVAQAGFESLKKLNENRINISIFNI